MNVIGIDPGLNGALALLCDGEIHDLVDMPVVDGNVDPWRLTWQLANWGSVRKVIVEKQQAYPKQGVSSSFKTGFGYGTVCAVIAALERPLHIVSASEWTRWLKVGNDKDAHRRKAKELWPGCAEMFARSKDDGRADAALLACWGSQLAPLHLESAS